MIGHKEVLSMAGLPFKESQIFRRSFLCVISLCVAHEAGCRALDSTALDAKFGSVMQGTPNHLGDQ